MSQSKFFVEIISECLFVKLVNTWVEVFSPSTFLDQMVKASKKYADSQTCYPIINMPLATTYAHMQIVFSDMHTCSTYTHAFYQMPKSVSKR